MRILHIGNIANNAYNNAKFLRRKGIEADVLSYDYFHIMGQPEWEDARFDLVLDEFNPQWDQVDLQGFHCPTWFIREELAPRVPGRRKQWFRGQFRLEHLVRDPVRWIQVFVKYRLSCINGGDRYSPRLGDFFKIYPFRKWFQQWFRHYDLIQAYATEPIHAMLFAPDRPFIAYEHGTMRDIPFENSTTGRLLALAYRKAGKVIITNPDVIGSARRLELKNFQFIPHPVDETKYRPKPTLLRHQLVDQYQTNLILFAPSRHDWVLKGNDRLIRAFAQLRKETSSRPILILCEWGQELDRSRTLIRELGLEKAVVWTPPLNKMKLIEYYNAADIVLDQFTIGTFGTVTPEAMSCGKPVVLHFDRTVHEWCYAEMPPVLSAKEEKEIFGWMVELGGSPQARAQIGQASREWIEKHHGWELVADRQIEIYRELLGK
ncbi:MAG TPA: glycosyltransferase [Nitrospiraceae bacterium]|nr:glycosyltransferase [Nitrospiraceae bacterium]